MGRGGGDDDGTHKTGGEERVGDVTQWWHIYLACKRSPESISSNKAREKS